MKIAVIGGGINGVMSAWALAQAGFRVVVFERDEIMKATSSRSTKLLHGGLRYLEHGHLGLVREALKERRWWIENAPGLADRLELVLPIYKRSRRPRWKIAVGLAAYDRLAGTSNLGSHRWRGREELLQMCPELTAKDLIGGFTFFDGRMNDYQLGIWAAQRAVAAGVEIADRAPVEKVSTHGQLLLNGAQLSFDAIVNVAGPWAKQLLDRSEIPSDYSLDLVRGSHLVLNRSVSRGYLVEVPGEERICFVLPYQGKTLLGTTELVQTLDEPIRCAEEERSYLMAVYNHYFSSQIDETAIVDEFSGVRPLIRSRRNPSRASREYAIETTGKLVNVFGGKWTTARSLGIKVADAVGTITKRV